MRKLFLVLSLAIVLPGTLMIARGNVRATKVDNQTVQDFKVEIASLESPVARTSAVFQELKSKASASAKESWIYINERVTHDVDPLPAIEGLLPLIDTDTDIWYYVDPSGFVNQFVAIEKTLDGKITQVGIYSNGTAWNTTVDEIVFMEPFLFGDLVYGLGSYLNNPSLTVNNVLRNGQYLTEFTISILESEPVDMLDYDKALLSIEHYFAFDPSTGFPVNKKTIVHLEDGSLRELDNIQVSIKIEVSPPAEVLEYFEIKANREESK